MYEIKKDTGNMEEDVLLVDENLGVLELGESIRIIL